MHSKGVTFKACEGYRSKMRRSSLPFPLIWFVGLLGITHVYNALAQPAAFGVEELILVDAENDIPIPGAFDCTPNACLGSVTLFNIRAETFGDVGSVRLEIDGPIKKTQLENVDPYALWGDTDGDYAGTFLPQGTFTVTAQAFSQENGKGEASEPLFISFSTFRNVPTPSAPIPAPAPQPTPAPVSAGGFSMYINAGSSSYTDPSGNVWKPDTEFVDSGGLFETQTAISGTLLDPLYQIERYGPRLVYSIPVPSGNYDVFLYMSEIYFDSAGSCVFDIELEGAVEFPDVDIFSEANGAYRALVKSKLNLPVTDGILTIALIGKIQNAKVQGIEVKQRSSEPTPTVSPPPPKPTPPPQPLPTPPPQPLPTLPLGDSIFRLNAGSSSYTDPAGNVWESDTDFVDSGSLFETQTAISGTILDPLYQIERYGPRLVYSIPVPNGNYDVFLYFSEIYFDSAGSRVFDIELEGAVEFPDVDIFSEANGAYRALIKSKLDFPVSDGVLTIELVGKTQNAKVQGIEVRPAASGPTPTTPPPVPPPTPPPQPQPTPPPVPPPTPASDGAVAKYINAGSDENYEDTMTGTVWEADSNYISSGGVFSTEAPISGTNNDPLYQSERYGPMVYSIPVPSGTYSVTFHVAEIYFGSPGARVFDIKVERSTVVPDLDVYSEAGGENRAYTKSVTGVDVTDGALTIEFIGVVQNPAIKAIEVRSFEAANNPGSFGLETSEIVVNRSAGEATISVLRMLGSDGLATIDYMTLPDTATAEEDYFDQEGTLTFEDGVTVQQITVPLVAGTEMQPSGEQFKLVIDNPVGAGLLAPRTATITLLSDSAMLPNYASFDSDEGLKLNGNAKIIGRALQLTANTQARQAGSAFYDTSISLADNGSFRSVFSFRIRGATTGAHGLTFTVQNDPDGAGALGSAGPGMGFEGISRAVAIEFDTSGSLGGEISDNHVSIVLNSVTNELTQVPASLDLNNGSTYHAWIDYNGESDSLSIYLSSTSTKPQYLLAEAKINLEAVVGITAWVGFTAGTGSTRTNAHEIISWQLDQLEPSFDPPRDPNLSLQQVDLVTNIDSPISIAWLPDETMLIAQKSGVVRVAIGNNLLPEPFVDISDIVNDRSDRGLLDIAVHPQFETYPYVYLLFTYEGVPPEQNFYTDDFAGPDGRGNRAGRLMRVTADSNNEYRTAIDGSDEILLGKNSIREFFNPEVDSTNDFNEPPAGVLPNGEYVPDFITSDSTSHTVGGLVFSPIDNTLYVSTGDGASYNTVDRRTFRVQDIDNLSGKVLRINPLNGEGLPDNPFYNGDVRADRSKVFQLGLRNPWRLSVDYLSGQLFIGEVGWITWEEVNAGQAGANFGWPYYEGGSGESLPNPNGYVDTPEGQAFFSQPDPLGRVVAPIYALNHERDDINAIVLGAKLSSSYYGEELRGNLFLNDLGNGIIRRISFDASGDIKGIDVFANDARYFVKIAEGPDGALYYCALLGDKVGRWEFI